MNTKNKASKERTRNTSKFTVDAIALAVVLVSAAITVAIQVNAQVNKG